MSVITARKSRTSAWLLISTVVAAVLFVVSAIVVMPAGIEYSGLLTPAQMADIRPGWVVMALLWSAPIWLAAAAFQRIPSASRATRTVIGIAAAGMTVYLVLTLSVLSFDASRLADLGRHDAAILVSLGSYWLALIATGLLGLGLSRRTGKVVAVIAALLLLADVIAYLPALAGSADLEHVASFPPMIISLLWLTVGVALARRPVASAP